MQGGGGRRGRNTQKLDESARIREILPPASTAGQERSFVLASSGLWTPKHFVSHINSTFCKTFISQNHIDFSGEHFLCLPVGRLCSPASCLEDCSSAERQRSQMKPHPVLEVGENANFACLLLCCHSQQLTLRANPSPSYGSEGSWLTLPCSESSDLRAVNLRSFLLMLKAPPIISN